MVCVYCGDNTHVNNSRSAKKSNRTWRRRVCKGCQSSFTTIEEVEFPSSLLFRNTLGLLEPFERDKLYISIYRACQHRKGAVSEAKALTATVLTHLSPRIDQAVLDRLAIIDVATEVLGRFDYAAGIQYSAYHPL